MQICFWEPTSPCGLSRALGWPAGRQHPAPVRDDPPAVSPCCPAAAWSPVTGHSLQPPLPCPGCTGTPGPFPVRDPSQSHTRLAALVHPLGVSSSNTFSVRPSRAPEGRRSTWAPPGPLDSSATRARRRWEWASSLLAVLWNPRGRGGRESTGQQEWSQPRAWQQ